MKKKPNPTDATLRNIRALKKRVSALSVRISHVHTFWEACTGYDRQRITALESEVKKIRKAIAPGRKGAR